MYRSPVLAARIGRVPAANPVDGPGTLEAYGVLLEITASDEQHRDRIMRLLPPGWRAASGKPQQGRFAVSSGPDDTVQVTLDGSSLADRADLDVGLGLLDAQVRAFVALHAPEHIFVHAGVVGVDDRAVLLPGYSFAGKTTLVAELVRAGATYYSDEYAVLDAEGLVHPYAKPLSVRMGSSRGTEEQPVESLGGRVGERPLTAGLIAVTSYRPGATWSPRRLSPGEGALALLSHTIPARSRPEQALSAVRCAVGDAVVLQGERGDARETAAELLATLRGEV